jgi:(2R)-3-sulfolactate dehydrogenase (NADP+)
VSTATLSLAEAEDPAIRILVAHGTAPENAGPAARALVAAEADGLKGHGLARLETYAPQAASGKVDGRAVPTLEKVGAAAFRVDARHGFAYPALALAVGAIVEAAPIAGIAAAGVFNSHHCGAAGHHAERLAEAGLVGLVFANTPKAIAPWGGREALFGTNPVAFAAPRAGARPLVIDMSLSKVARGKIMVAAQKGEPIPEGWALDADGRPITDAKAALAGTMMPMGDAKGAALVMMVEVLAAAVTGASFGYEASSFFTADGPPPSVGQLLIGLDAGALSGGAYAARLEDLAAAVLDQPGTRLPGARRLENRRRADSVGLAVDAELHERLLALAGIGD